MKPATRPPHRRDEVRLLTIDSVTQEIRSVPFTAITKLLDPGDLVVVNDAATLPASIEIETESGQHLEIRIARVFPKRVLAFGLGSGSWRTDTELRDSPPELESGSLLYSCGAVFGKVIRQHGRLLEVAVDASELIEKLYRNGRPVQYSYLENDLELWSIQTAFASRPVASEMPSAGRPFSWNVLLALRERGVEIARLTHAAGLSSSGDPTLDAQLPLEEWYEISKQTADAITHARRRGSRVIAVGTSVVRALESAAKNGSVPEGQGTTALRISSSTKLSVVDSIVTGIHERGTSHFELLGAFANQRVLSDAWSLAETRSFRSHELGDVALIAPRIEVGYLTGATPRRPKSSSTAIAAAIVR